MLSYERNNGYHSCIFFCITTLFFLLQNKIRTWWPNGYGEQPLYKLNVNFMAPKERLDEASYKTLMIGFRTVQLIESDASEIFGELFCN